jgi:hypothetical protein
MNTLLVVDGASFVLIGLIVVAIPSPQPALVRAVDEAVALLPFVHTRRLLASQFIGNGLQALVLASAQGSSLRLAAAARLVTIALVLAINGAQLRSGVWKRPPLYLIIAVLAVFAIGYARLLLRAA